MTNSTLTSLSATVLIVVLLGVWLFYLRAIDQRELYEPPKKLVFSGSYVTFPVNWVLGDHELLFGLRFETKTPTGLLYLNKVYDDKFWCVYLEGGKLYLNKGLFDRNKVLLWPKNLADGVPHDIRVYWAFDQFVVEVDGEPLRYVTPPNTDPMVNGRHISVGGGLVHLSVGPFYGCIYYIETPVDILTYLNFTDSTLPPGVTAGPCK